jgi:hypothetical protein
VIPLLSKADGGIFAFQIMRHLFLESLVILRRNFIDENLFFRLSIEEIRPNSDIDILIDFECSILIKSLIQTFVLIQKIYSPTVSECFFSFNIYRRYRKSVRLNKFLP